MPLQPQLIVVGGFADSGKSTLAKKLGNRLAIPVFEIDQLARTIRDSKDFMASVVKLMELPSTCFLRLRTLICKTDAV